ncbi:DNA-3-methyladenine glycosylase family protein [Virgibacillus doumboii]|uniref:DNA-3-methyladenine glycosylase family protein n=1 Tax=Virgibacillus doumboii TaxID=2697503 RepID=UPI0013DFD18A|nr:DNA-3-methyladenine glycosylase 2 family protein [Virgibacillus doumboii]
MDKITIRTDDQAVKELSDVDLQMKKLVEIVGDIEVKMRPDLFKSLVRSMIGQQISVAAASAIFGRLEELLDYDITADAFFETSHEQLRSIGLSARKITYLGDLAEKVHKNKIELDKLHEQDNEKIIKQLTSIKGIGKWTAEMFLIFSLGRMNVLAVDDIGIQRGAKWLYEVDKSERRKILIDKEPIWNPHLTIASFYLWEVVHLDFERKYNSIDEIQGGK